MEYFHSVRLRDTLCNGCTRCVKVCPTEAIRVKGKAEIIDVRCIDCGECIRICPQHAKTGKVDSLKDLEKYKYNIALPDPAIFGQFSHNIQPQKILGAFIAMGFDSVFDVAIACDYVSLAIRNVLKNHSGPPFISASCPAVIRLVQALHPDLIPHLIPVEAPLEIAGGLALEEGLKKGYKKEEIGVFYISPCPAKVTAVKQPVAREKSNVNEVLSIVDLYGNILKYISSDKTKALELKATGLGYGWARAGGESLAIKCSDNVVIDGIEQVNKVLNEIEIGKLTDVEYIECWACIGGCVGGPMLVENPFIARVRVRKLAESIGGDLSIEKLKEFPPEYFNWQMSMKPRQIMKYDEDISSAIAKANKIQNLLKSLPGFDCGICGAPTCHAHVEDFIQGKISGLSCLLNKRGDSSDS
ncbi:[Fe-Fe] hydrogenase large subunit C-terminal domain-containing protein [Anaerobranca gottschalkii]|uniref:Iron only hydrogenase large subunit, C-terminal domain n=1 Tax=Anaerobranca gottschalkii DSM 13577 TaxID=1120990 RepID=A0A1H9YAH0_9FIRM|nr:[Fe-Fe] hydrogenase large subunit C-terminal domain-containing protein [Anaerobranca gottschalkii]SES65399.1 Iron only hydrogenase large subunit, C-terminal domain [Anaerobranca gottschalkii DSM 13577]